METSKGKIHLTERTYIEASIFLLISKTKNKGNQQNLSPLQHRQCRQDVCSARMSSHTKAQPHARGTHKQPKRVSSPLDRCEG